MAFDFVGTLTKETSEPANDDGEVLIPIDSLREGDSPRIDGIDEAHAKLMAESGNVLPAIYVQRGTMRIIDGMHRVLAARLKNETHVLAKFFDDDDDDAYLRGVAANITHGRPLTLADRKAVALRVIEKNPEWSDRAVAAAAGISGKTVGALRRANKEIAHLDRRRGQDGRVRPINGAVGRQVASEMLANNPDASLREIARVAGVSPTTVRDVRDRMRRGDAPVLATQLRPPPDTHGTMHPKERETPTSSGAEEGVDCRTTLKTLGRDPSLRYTEAGRTLLRWLNTHPLGDDGEEFVAALPPHSVPVVARLIAQYARQWEGLAELVATRARSSRA